MTSKLDINHSNGLPTVKPIIISGPCSAESPEQLMSTAQELAKTGKINILRAGVWKPRTRPNAFEGIGEEALQWLADAGKETHLPTSTEVATTGHVESALKAGIDILWIGARTTTNPFSVQAIADALKGIDIPVMVKNPINPDLALWLGGIERLQKAGLTKLAAIHRGFSFAGEKFYRNRPQWQYAIDFKQAMPDIPMINDPSHICGRRDILGKVSQKAMDLNFDGLMIESHITPDEAWSDAKQQITPEVLDEMISHLILREYDPQNVKERTELEKLRKEIDLLDDELLNLLASRMMVAKKIGEYKKDNNITILQSDRWQEILDKFKSKAHNHGLSEGFITSIIKNIHNESINQQEKILIEGQDL